MNQIDYFITSITSSLFDHLTACSSLGNECGYAKQSSRRLQRTLLSCSVNSARESLLNKLLNKLLSFSSAYGTSKH